MGPYPVDRPERFSKNEQDLFLSTAVPNTPETFCHPIPSSDNPSLLWCLGKTKKENRATSSVCETQHFSCCSFHHSTYEELDSRAFSSLPFPFNSTPPPTLSHPSPQGARSSPQCPACLSSHVEGALQGREVRSTSQGVWRQGLEGGEETLKLGVQPPGGNVVHAERPGTCGVARAKGEASEETSPVVVDPQLKDRSPRPVELRDAARSAPTAAAGALPARA